MDDPLSALDAHVKKSIFEEVILSELKNKTRILVTHSLDCLPRCDWIILLKKGEVEFDGPYQDLISTPFFAWIKSSLDNSHFEDSGEEESKEKQAFSNSPSKSYLSSKGTSINTKE